MLALAGVVALGMVLRAVYVLVVLDHVRAGLDAVWYSLQGGSIRRGTGYVKPGSLFTGPRIPTAGFPPVHPAYQAAWQWVFGAGHATVRLAEMVPGGITIALTGLFGRDVAGPTVGLIAASIVAVDPLLFAVDGSSMSENVTVPLVLGAVLVAHRVAHRGPLRPGRQCSACCAGSPH